MERKKIILDCDPGMDDSMAIVMAAKSPVLDLLAVTAVNGNYPVDVAAANAQKTLEMLNMTHIPVAKGMAQPMVTPCPKDPFSHGADGQGENFLPAPTMALHPLHAVDLLIELVQKHPHEITILCTGPMSNLAMAITKEPSIKPLIKEVIAISGAFGFNEYSFLNATGDTPQSEWNVFVDPEAADVVYNSGIPLVALGLDVATHFDVNFSAEDVDLFTNSPKKEANFLAQAIRFVNGRGFEAYCTIIDCMAVGYAIDSTLVDTKQCKCGVETGGKMTRGMTVRDGRHHFTWEHLPIITVGVHAQYDTFLNLIKELVLQ